MLPTWIDIYVDRKQYNEHIIMILFSTYFVIWNDYKTAHHVRVELIAKGVAKGKFLP